MAIVNILFAFVSICVFGFFALNLKKRWATIQLGKGHEDNRFDQFGRRIQDMVLFGFLQQKMFKELTSGVMHAFIFWGL